MPGAYVPARGDIIWLDFNPQAGHEQAGHRPALVLTGQRYNRVTGMAICCPITTRPKGYPFEVPLGASASITGAVLSDQAKSLDWRARNAKRATRVTPEILADVTHRVTVLISSN
ncbi:MAG: endoribonuclease MazF [Nevskiales bacterium]